MSMTKLKMTAFTLLGLALVWGEAGSFACHVLADEPVSVKNSPPVVVQTVPQAGDTKVDASKVTEIKVTYSKEMVDKSWSWSQISDETFPKLNGKPHYDKDKR